MLIDGVNCEGDVVVPSNVKAIAGGAFYGNTKLTSITAPTSVKEINESTFWQCENLVSADLKGVENIGVTAFGCCAKLNEMKLPGKMKTIETYAFCDCTSHATITVFGTEAEWSQVQILDSSSDFLKNATYIFDSTPIEDPPQEIVGDVDGDGAFTVLDVVALQKWLLAIPGATLSDPDAADMDKNEILDVFDLGLMKRALLKQ
jgi:hypothetical protein